MAKYQGPVFHRRLQSERTVQKTSPREVRKQQEKSPTNDIPFFKHHEAKPATEPTLSKKGLTHKVTPYQEDRSSTPFKVKKVPSPFYGYQERREEKKESIQYAIIYQNLTKENEDFLLFEDYLSELGKEQFEQTDSNSEQEVLETPEAEKDLLLLEENDEIDLNEEIIEDSSTVEDDVSDELLVPRVEEEVSNDFLEEESFVSEQVPENNMLKETKKRGLSRSLAGMIQEEQDERLNKGKNIARYFEESNSRENSQPATITELLARANQGEDPKELEAILDTPMTAEDQLVATKVDTEFEEAVVEEFIQIAEPAAEEIAESNQEESFDNSAAYTEQIEKVPQEEEGNELESVIEEPSQMETEASLEISALDVEEVENTPIEVEQEESASDSTAAYPATITELLAQMTQGGAYTDELESLLEDPTPDSVVSKEDFVPSKEPIVVDAEIIEAEENETEEPTLLGESPNEVNDLREGEEESPLLLEEAKADVMIPEDTTKEDETSRSIEDSLTNEPDTLYSEPEEAHQSEVIDQEEIDEKNQEMDTEKWKPVEGRLAAENQSLHYQFPSLDLLNEPITFEPNAIDDWVLEQAECLNETLEAFNIEAQVVGWTIGPAITQFELQLGRGVKVNKITNLSDDLKLALAAKDIRIEAPIPGKSTVGVEIPNLKSRPVMISEVIESEAFENSDSPLTIAMGVNLAGEAVVSTIDKMPHGLIAGATGSGKSVFINSLLVSLLYKATPNEVKLILIDPKAVELAPYNDLPHLLSPVISEPKAANEALKWAVNEMEERYQKLAAGGVRNIEHFNKKAEARGDHALKMPYIVIIIDELADLMMVASNEVQESIARITQKARAAGIHLIVATQRPSVDVVTGTIKNNIPTRIAFMVSSQVDSRTILDTGGAEKLLGRGDMLFQGNGASQPVRIQGTYVEEEIDGIVDFVKEQQEPNYLFQSESLLAKAEALEGKDELLDEVLPFIIDEGTVSASSLQRKFKIGFNRASNLIDALESKNLISENKGSRPRDVFLTRSDYEEKFL
ncbi:DNA translocase FtsK [Desemzia incerta]|uniref:DNA translocase FtsK n=1 Tax=Desemzia incerta TaxID=82801 RepID=UPI003D9EAC80